MKYHICCATDDNYAQHCAVMLCSLFENNRCEQFVIHIITSDLNSEYMEQLQTLIQRYHSKCIFYNADVNRLAGVQYREKRSLTEAAYYRILLASILETSIVRVLYLDCDLLVLRNVTPLFKIELDDYALAAVKEPVDILDNHRMQLSLPYGGDYFNSGVMLINLDYWRKNDIEDRLIEFSKRKRFVYCHDQDALNYVFKGKWFKLPPKWNRSNLATSDEIEFECVVDELEYIKKPIIIHFIDEPKPWQGILLMKNRKIYYKYLLILEWQELPGIQSQKLYRVKKRELYIRVFVFYVKSVLNSVGLLKVFKRFKIVNLESVKYDT